MLEKAQVNKWPDPLQDKFADAYKVEYGRATAYKEIFNIMELSEGMIKNLVKQINDPEKNYEI